MDDYEYDVFISYRHSTAAGIWVRKYFFPELVKWLADYFPQAPKVFLDSDAIRAGHLWKDKLTRTIQRSKCLIAILNAPYFSSDYCAAEWHSFVQREQMITDETGESDIQLIIPIRFIDGDHFHSTVRARQLIDMESWAITAPAFVDSPKYVEFEKEIRRIASVLAEGPEAILGKIPPFRKWPAIFPAPDTSPTLNFVPRVT